MIGCRILVVDDDPFALTTLCATLEYLRLEVVARATSARDALALQATSSAQVALLDLDLGPGPTGIDLAHALRLQQPDLGLVVLSTYRDPRLVAPGSIAPPTGTSYLAKGDVSDVLQLRQVITAVVREPLRQRQWLQDTLPELSDLQLQVLRALAAGFSTQAIATERGVSISAIEQTITRLYEVFDMPRDPEHNQRVRLARAYLELAGKLV
ncbi:MAG: response regulator transcription factor [Actinomycetales bacterium]|nr:response regulator transcription factor [Actinomycetales bacterium]